VAGVTLFPCAFDVPCDAFACSKPARWFVGRHDGPLNLCFKLCQDCAASLVANIPQELLPQTTVSESSNEVPNQEQAEEAVQVEAQEEAAGLRNYICLKCGKAYASPQRLAAHMRACKAVPSHE